MITDIYTPQCTENNCLYDASVRCEECRAALCNWHAELVDDCHMCPSCAAPYITPPARKGEE